MGLLDAIQRIKNAVNEGRAAAVSGDVVVNAKDLLQQGILLEEQGRLADALYLYEAAIGLMPTLAKAHFKRGTLLLDRGDAQLALDALKVAISFKPDSVGAHLNMGNAHLLLGDLAAALSAYEHALQLNPGFADAQNALANAQSLAPEYAATCFQQGLASQDAGQLDLAEEHYRNALRTDPSHVDARNNLAGILLRDGRIDDAIVNFRRAAELDITNADIQLNLGDALQVQGKPDDALAYYVLAVNARPGSAAAHMRLAKLQGEAGLTTNAIASYKSALEVDPSNAEANLNLGIFLVDLGQLDAAANCYRRAIEIEPDCAEAHSNLGVVQKRGRDLSAAIVSLRHALKLKPDFAEAHVNLGSVLHALGQTNAAAASYMRAMEINPDSAVALSNYGTILQAQEKFDQAESIYLRALEIDPESAITHNNLGIVYSLIRRLDESVEQYQKAIRIKPDYADAYANLGGVLKDLGRLDESLNILNRALEIDTECLVAHNNLLFNQNYLADRSSEGLLVDAQRYGEVVARLAHPHTEWPNLADPERTLRVGFVSGDLCSHPVGYFLEGVLAALTVPVANRLELFAYPTRFNEDVTSQRLRACCKAWHSAVGLSDEALAKRIREDGIDILIDLSGHSAHNRLPVFAWKPAPLQVSWLGYFATTGVAAMDYFIADPWTLPPGQEAYFTEKIWRLPETRLCFTPPDAKVEVNALPALANGYITFGSFNNLSKMTDAVVQLWARVLQAVPQSRLFLKYQQLAEASVRQSTYKRFAVHGIEADRLIFEDYVPRASYLAAYHRVDIGLDPFPFPGGTTTVEALWMGIPVLTLAGERFLSRQGVGLLMNAGLPDWIAADPEDYVTRAVAHASDLPTLAILRGSLRKQVLASPIYDAPRFAQHFEQALRGMWQTWCESH